MSQELAGKVALVTGASKGIGAAIAKHLSSAGASVVVNYATDKGGAEDVVRDIAAAGGKAVAIQANVAMSSETRRLFENARKTFGRLDILVNNAGVYEFRPIEQVDEEHFHKHFNLNVLAVLIASQEAVKLFGPEGGSIINIGSVASTYTPPLSSVYSATKASVDAITRTLAKELGPRKIRVNSINPGAVITPGLHAAGLADGEFRNQIEREAPLRRIGQPDDIAPAVAFLASPDASWITGEILAVSGGIR